ncbi:hypothetical protein [Clostridium felsineum]|uniref:Uncharacterized protein n=1 Tax=Clostridium felsineum TaxID=36839 RepID=A0A1S8LDA2_9CLOT|nr:hypothetical protein [Clostridium felsineum]URZ05880.1 hypothetical protein CLROS_012120 [Clostridium felsineum]URZ10917.1 hypothetical protein CROST_016330 [Clostridium felsineum]URZ15411.1 hypothetical protein CLFE_014510 [Clostridium felsineum DSM 794]
MEIELRFKPEKEDRGWKYRQMYFKFKDNSKAKKDIKLKGDRQCK